MVVTYCTAWDISSYKNVVFTHCTVFGAFFNMKVWFYTRCCIWDVCSHKNIVLYTALNYGRPFTLNLVLYVALDLEHLFI
jgi:hypothetical protein